MAYTISRRSFLAGTGVLGLAVLAGCSSGGSSGASASSGSASGPAAASAVTVGTLETEDLLPLWVAKEGGLEVAGHQVDIVPFQSATELIAGFSANEVDLAMTDIMVAASMFAGGVNLQIEWITLGAQADQGRFGIMVGPNSSAQTLKDLAGQKIGVGTNTILEYVMDCLMEEAGVAEDQIVVEELQKLPVRYQAMISGNVPAAALPGSLLALGEANGCRTIADDTKGKNLSQSIMIAGDKFLKREDAPEILSGLKAAWDSAVVKVNQDPESYRSVLIAHANLSDEVKGTYPISKYPSCELPTKEMVNPILSWMERKGYLTKSLSYDEKTGSFSAA